MKQLVQNLKTGQMRIVEVPVPALPSKNVLVRVHHSLISAGTESTKVATARKGYLGKAKEKPEQVKQVLDTLKKEGVGQTYRKVMNKLDAWSPLGYSCAGEVIEVGSEIATFQQGDLVACAGADMANHAQVVSVPLNLCVKLPDNVTTEQAAYTTLGAIAMQGVRQADLRLGESCLVIGLGLLGQLTVQMLKAAGTIVMGVDLSPAAVENGIKSGADLCFNRNDEQLEQAVLDVTQGYGVDAVIITAAAASLDPVELAGRLTRKKGRVIIVGSVPTGFSRENYYKKELELRMSTSYGPGRYDPEYEEKGRDYPYGYVRWTENRNMQSFLQLVSRGKINFDHLTTHRFDFNDALQAYDMILNKSEPFLGVILKYDVGTKVTGTVFLKTSASKTAKIKIGFIGAGSFAQSYLLPNIPKDRHTELVGVATASGNNARTVAEKYGFRFASGDYQEIISSDDINTIFIATRHDLHGQLVIEALKAGKHVFVEKPLTLKPEELEEIKNLYNSKSITQQSTFPLLMVGFNRRFAPLVRRIKETHTQPPFAINYRINAGFIPKEHWIQDKMIGGGRIIGEVCHFTDLAACLAGSRPQAVSAFVMDDGLGMNDTLTVNLVFENGSVASVNYFSNGSKALPKEYLEIHGHGVSSCLNDFNTLEIFTKKKKSYKHIGQDKGHKNEVQAFLSCIKEGSPAPIPFEEIYLSSLVPFKIIESIQKKMLITF